MISRDKMFVPCIYFAHLLLLVRPVFGQAGTDPSDTLFWTKIVPTWRDIREKLLNLEGEYVARGTESFNGRTDAPEIDRTVPAKVSKFFCRDGMQRFEVRSDEGILETAIVSNGKQQFIVVRSGSEEQEKEPFVVADFGDIVSNGAAGISRDSALRPLLAALRIGVGPRLDESDASSAFKVESLQRNGNGRIQVLLVRDSKSAAGTTEVNLLLNEANYFAIEDWKFKNKLISASGKNTYNSDKGIPLPKAVKWEEVVAGIVRKRIEVEFSNVAACALGDDAFTLSSFGIAGPQRNFNKPYLGLNPWQAGLAAVSLFLLALGAWNKSTKKRE